MVKISIAIMLLRIKTTKIWRIGLYFLLGSLVFVGVMSTIIVLVMCRPISAFWSLTDRTSHCWAPNTMALAPVIWYCKEPLAVTCTANLIAYFAATDFILALLPLTFIRQLNRPMREKIVLGVLMGFGMFTGVSAVVKTCYIKEFTTSADYFYELSSLSIWTYVSLSHPILQPLTTKSMLELFIGVIATCVPCLKVPADNLLRKFGVQISTMRSGTQDQVTARSRAAGYGGGGTYGASSKSGGTHVRMSTLASQGGPPGDPVSDDEIGGGVWDGRRGIADARVTATDARKAGEKGGIVKDTHFTWETSSAGS
jgi:hypothetical protein